MPEGYLYDLSLSFYQQAVVTDGQFDPEKAAALGYSSAQFTVIQEFLGLDMKDTAPLPPVENGEE
jgi:hypothetical protein